ncbi:hypothetical protein TCE0_017r03386 [Talaromyces pinophilus]|uniref:Cytochrome P450 n=1 Tax=Talaromyces pinophilus TaxID=128442 RepID=A0A6V8H2J2_TALPI|nr:hypothetical protein TCE0_017r03386 [Talaromyces pinophilus]
MKQLLDDPLGYNDHIRRYSTGVILLSVFGILETGATPPIDVFPFLKYMPDFMSPWRKWALEIRTKQRTLYFDLLNQVKENIATGNYNGCFMEKLLPDKNHAIDDEHLEYIGGVLMEGGSDTTSSTLLSFILAMVKYPDDLKKAHEEADRVCGENRSPTFADLPDILYIRACVSEVLRWRPVAAGGIPHQLIQDDMYNGYIFPKGRIFVANTWSIHHDPDLYDKPDEFIPERYLRNEMGFRTGVTDIDGIRKTYAFGAGRRICPGQHLAENSLLINIAKLVWAFEFLPGKNPVTGEPLSKDAIDTSVVTAWTDGFLTAPIKFPLQIAVRSSNHAEVITRESNTSGEAFDDLHGK